MIASIVRVIFFNKKIASITSDLTKTIECTVSDVTVLIKQVTC